MAEELSKGFTGIEINGVRFSNIKEMLIYMNKQRARIIDLNAQLDQAKEIINELLMNSYDENTREKALDFCTQIKRRINNYD